MLHSLEAVLFLAQASGETSDTDAASILASLLVTWGPFFLFVLIVYFVLRKSLSRNRSVIDQSFQNMKTMEAKTDEMIELLRSINDKLDGRGK